jgi:hypothetical protein
MQEEKITRINVGGQATGIIGLKAILEEIAIEFKGRSDEDINAELLNRLLSINYNKTYRNKP